MAIKNLTKKINWRFMGRHFIAAWFISQAFPVLCCLYNAKMFTAIQKMAYYPHEVDSYLKANNYTYSNIFSYFFYVQQTWMIGLSAALVISLILAKKQKVFWLNSLIMFITLFVLYTLDITGWTYAKHVFLTPGELFNNPIGNLLTNGLILLFIGLFIFFFNSPRKLAQQSNATVAAG